MENKPVRPTPKPPSRAEAEMRILARGSAGKVLHAYLLERQQDRTNKVFEGNKDTFEVNKGRYLELADLLKFLES